MSDNPFKPGAALRIIIDMVGFFGGEDTTVWLRFDDIIVCLGEQESQNLMSYNFDMEESPIVCRFLTCKGILERFTDNIKPDWFEEIA